MWLTLTSVLLLAVMVDMRWDRRRKQWLRFVSRIVELCAATWFLQRAANSPLDPDVPGAAIFHVWTLLVETGWWLLAARVAVSLLRLIVVLEHRPRETKMISDLLAGLIYVAVALAVVNFVFGVAIAGLVATSGVLAILFGLALQSTLSDVLGFPIQSPSDTACCARSAPVSANACWSRILLVLRSADPRTSSFEFGMQTKPELEFRDWPSGSYHATPVRPIGTDPAERTPTSPFNHPDGLDNPDRSDDL